MGWMTINLIPCFDPSTCDNDVDVGYFFPLVERTKGVKGYYLLGKCVLTAVCTQCNGFVCLPAKPNMQREGRLSNLSSSEFEVKTWIVVSQNVTFFAAAEDAKRRVTWQRH